MFGTPEFEAALWELFALRRDVRRFRPRPVDERDVTRILTAAHAAPSVGLSQPWRFVLVESPERRAQVVANFEAENERCARAYDDDRAAAYRALKLAGLREAPIHLAVLVDPDPATGHGLGRQTQPETVAYSAVCAIQNLWLAARAIGLGVGWVSILDPAPLRDALALPTTWQWIAYLCIGYPEQSHDDVPALERHGWEHRAPLRAHVLRR